MLNKLLKFLKYDFFTKKSVIENLYYKYKTQVFYKLFFKKLGKNSIIKKPLIITPESIEIGKNVYILYHSRIEGIVEYCERKYNPKIIIEDGVSFQQNIHLTCANKIFIDKNVAIASNVTITDINHTYLDINIPIEHQKLEVREVYIGENSKIYNNCVILPGCKIGKHCVIGANSVVNKDIPDYSVVVGAPAKIVKRYNFKTKKWEKTNEKENL